MNLDELKKGWGVLNERLSQNEVVSQRIIKEMILCKTNSAYDNIYRASKWSLMVIFFAGLLLPFAKMQGMPIYRETFIAMEAFIFLGFLFEGYLFYLLSRFNLNTMKVDEAMRSNLKTVRIIHGKGTGVLRAAVHQSLRKNKFVKKYRLGVYGEGEDGVTIAEFS